MWHLSIDIETFSSVNIQKAGLYRYVQSPDFEILLFAYSWDSGPVQIVDLAQGETVPAEVIQALGDVRVVKHAYNAAFEWYCLNKFWPSPVEQWRCTMVHGLYCGYPSGLGKVGEALGLPQDKRKMGVGGALIRTFCVPTKPAKSNGHRTRTLPHHEPEKWRTFKQYCVGDVVAEMEILRRLSPFPVPESEWRLWQLDQRINSRGIACDMQLVDGALAVDEQITTELMAEAVQLSGLDNPKSVQQLKKWLAEEIGEEVEDLRKDTVSGLIKTVEEGKAKRVLEIRRELSKTSTKKYAAIRTVACEDGRVRGLLQFYGANRTGRWAGRLVQVHNLPKNKDGFPIELARRLVRERRVDMLKFVFGNVPDALSQLIRTAFIAPDGKKLLVADFSAIEARVLAWLAGEQWRLDVFAGHGKIYEASASQMFGIPLEEITKDLRQKGKVSELALGYQGAAGALIAMGALDMGLSEDELPEIVTRWRNANRRICDLWYSFEAAAIEVMETGQPVGVRGIIFARESHHGNQLDFFTVQLPSGRKLYYVEPRLAQNDFGKSALHYMGPDQKTGKWSLISTYGGKLVENCLAAGTLVLTEAGWKPIENVSRADRVWDGVEWVTHQGLKASGTQRTVSVDGVRMTPDHQIMTESGWRNASSCEGHNRASVTLPDGSFVCRIRRKKVALVYPRRLRRGFHDGGQRVQKGQTEVLRLPAREANLAKPDRTRHVPAPGVCSVALHDRPVQSTDAPSLAQLRCSRHSGVSSVGGKFRNLLAGHGAELPVGADDRAGRCERSLRAWELHLGDHETASQQQEKQSSDSDALGQNDCGGGSRSGRDQALNDVLPAEPWLSAGLTVQRGECAEPVYDLLNAGPRHRFTVLGGSGPIIVHNCVQAIARDCLALTLQRAEESGYDTVLHVHDELGVESARVEELDKVLALMAEPIPWALGLPLKGAGFTTEFYMKD